MITIKNVKTLDGQVKDVSLEGQAYTLDAEEKLTLLPALINPYVPFERPREYAHSALQGGFTTLYIAANIPPLHTTADAFTAKMHDIDTQLAEAKIPLRHRLFFDLDPDHIEEVGKVKSEIAGLEITFENRDLNSLEKAFQRAAQDNMMIAIHPNMSNNKATYKELKRIVDFAEKYNTPLFFTRLSNKEELNLLKEAKSKELMVVAAVSATALFLAENEDYEALWNGIHEGTIDAISSEIAEMEILLPLLLTAYSDKKITLEQIVNLTRVNSEMLLLSELFHNDDFLLVDLEKRKEVVDKKSPFAGRVLKGWPTHTILRGHIYPLTP